MQNSADSGLGTAHPFKLDSYHRCDGRPLTWHFSPVTDSGDNSGSGTMVPRDIKCVSDRPFIVRFLAHTYRVDLLFAGFPGTPAALVPSPRQRVLHVSLNKAHVWSAGRA